VRGTTVFVLSGFLAIAPSRAAAIVWPDVAERVERDMSAADPATRRAAARELASLGPVRGGPLATAALGDADDDVRLAAADAAIRLRAAGAADAVAGWLNAPDVRLRRKACEVARALPSARAVTPLARTLSDPDAEVRAAAAEALGHQSSGEPVPPLLGRLDDPTPAVRLQIVAALARLGDVRAVVPLTGKVQDSSPEVRQAVARALGDLGDPRGSPALILALRDQNDEVRHDALSALGRMRAADAVDAIAPFTTDRAPTLRAAAFGALGRIGSTDAVRVLIGTMGAADNDADSLERTPVREALVSAGADAVPQLHALLAASPSPQEAASAAWVFGELHATAEAPTIVAALRRGTLPTAVALHALAKAGSPGDVPVVLEFLADPNPVVRLEALGTATALLDPHHPDGRAVEPLAAVLRNTTPSTQERARIATLLGRTGAPRAAPLLVDLEHAADGPLRLAAIDALGMLGPASGDAALLDALGSADATVRVHAAIAISEAGGGRTRDALLAQLDGGDEVDRAAVLTALGGVLSRAPTDAAVARLVGALEMAAGAERDAIVEALGRAPLPSAVRALAAVANSLEPADRQAAALLSAAHPGDPTALATARKLLADADPGVRAQAAWSLGSIGDAADIGPIEAIAGGSDANSSVDAAAAAGRIAARAHAPALASRALCPLEHDPRPLVRANALAGLALAGARCGDGSTERAMLADDASEDARAAAALAIARAPGADDVRALERCARRDASGTVAERCRQRPAPPDRTHPALIYVVAEGLSVPRAGAAYAVLLADGTVHAGTTDRRGATFDAVAPEGQITLRPAELLSARKW